MSGECVVFEKDVLDVRCFCVRVNSVSHMYNGYPSSSVRGKLSLYHVVYKVCKLIPSFLERGCCMKSSNSSC